MMERNRKIVKKAIKHLPQYSLIGNEIWSSIENILAQKEYLSIPNSYELPVFKAPEKVWAKIESQLNEKETILKRAIDEMPLYKAPQEIWVKIDLQMGRKYLWFFDFRKIAAAAIFLIALGLGLILLQRQNRSGLTLTDENYDTDSNKKSSSDGGPESIYNPAFCVGNPGVCNSTLFKELDSQLRTLKNELTKMEPLLKQNDPQLQNYYYRLENEKAEIEKHIIRLIIES